MLVLPPTPTISQTRELLGSLCTTANCVKKCFFKNRSPICGVISLQRNVPTDKIKYSLETPFLSRFFIFYDFLNLNQDFRANLRCKSCVQLPILWKTRFSQTLRCHIFAMKRPTDKIKHSLETPFFSRFFIFLLHFEFKLRFKAQNAMWLQHPLPILALFLCG